MEGDVHGRGDGHHPQHRDDGLERLHRARARGDAAVGDETDGLVGPLPVQVVDRVLDRRGVAVVVLARDEHEGVGRVDRGAPSSRVLLRVLAQARMVGLVQERQVPLGEVGDLDVEPVVHADALDEPLRDGEARASGTGRGDDHGQRRHGRRDESGLPADARGDRAPGAVAREPGGREHAVARRIVIASQPRSRRSTPARARPWRTPRSRTRRRSPGRARPR